MGKMNEKKRIAQAGLLLLLLLAALGLSGCGTAAAEPGQSAAPGAQGQKPPLPEKLELNAQGVPLLRVYQVDEDAVQEMNAQVAAEADKVHSRVGTTSVMLAFQEDQLICCNVGDSRAYRLRNGVLSQLSTDHNDAEFLRRQGVTHRRPRLTQYIGLNPQEVRICPSWFRDNVAAGDKYLLCSDGLTDMLSDDEIGALLQESGTPEESVELLVHEALKQGGCDNTTVIVVTVQEE